MKRILASFQRYTGLTSSEATVVVIISAVLLTGWVGRTLAPPPATHDVATIRRIGAILDSLENAMSVRQPDADINAISTVNSSNNRPNQQKPKTPAFGKPLNVNIATKTQLMRLPGIGPALADRIIASRTESKFTSVDDLHRVKGIGPVKLERLRPFVIAP